MKTSQESQNTLLRIMLFCMMLSSFFAGFLHHTPGEQLNIHRIHVFLFNLCAGGMLILTYSTPPERRAVSWFFLVASLIFTISAALSSYPIAICAAFSCAALAEYARIRRFSFMPLDFFRNGVSIVTKFHHAAMLCLSTALLFSAMSMLARLWDISLPPKMTVDIFFLGFSFPVSLITMSLLFEKISSLQNGIDLSLSQFVFWAVNLGVIVFFIFILAEWVYPQIVIASLLIVPVCVMFCLFMKRFSGSDSHTLLISGISFLLTSAFSGVAYLAVKYLITESGLLLQKYILEFHRLASLYGWNQVGMLLLFEKSGFRIQRISRLAIASHWVGVALCAPLALFAWKCGLVASILYTAFLTIIFWKTGEQLR